MTRGPSPTSSSTAPDVVSAVAQRRADLSALTQNANEALGAIANENRSFDQALVALPGTLRQANTTFHNLRPALDDLDVLVNAAKPATKNLPTFLRHLKPVSSRSVPVFSDLEPRGQPEGQAERPRRRHRLPARAREARRRRDPDHGQGRCRTPRTNLAVPASRTSPDLMAGDRPPQPGRRATTTPTATTLRVAAGRPRRLLGARHLQDGRGQQLHLRAAERRRRLQRLRRLRRPELQHLPPLPGRRRPRSSPAATRSRLPSPAGVFLGPPNGTVTAGAAPASCDSTQTVPGP